MKAILAFIAIGLFLSTNAQTTFKKLVSKKFGSLNFSYSQVVREEMRDTSYLATMYFQNAKYKNIVDTKTIVFTGASEYAQFIKDGCDAFFLMGKGSSTNGYWDNSKYRLSLSQSSKILSIYDTDGLDGYTSLNKQGFSDLLDVMMAIDFGTSIINKKN
jgi:hypothetical protein